MKYYTQKTKTDCLLAAAENYTQKSRKKFGRLEWRKYGPNNDKYLTYSSFAKIINKHSCGAQIVFEGLVKLDYRPAIIGHIFTLNGRSICHSFFWNGKRAFCPARREFVNLSELDVTYCILHPNTQQDNSIKELDKVCKYWDEQCSLNMKYDPKPVKKLLSLSYAGRVYHGDLERANTNILADV